MSQKGKRQTAERNGKPTRRTTLKYHTVLWSIHSLPLLDQRSTGQCHGDAFIIQVLQAKPDLCHDRNTLHNSEIIRTKVLLR